MAYEADEYRLMATMKTVQKAGEALSSLAGRLMDAYESRRNDNKTPEDVRRDLDELQALCGETSEVLDALSEKLRRRSGETTDG
jgi:hypothetical protein